jgi:hypothetical protein
MEIDEILDALDESREELLLLLEPLPDEALLVPGVNNDRSVADILAHLAAWESELVTALLHIDQGKRPARILAAAEDVDAYNARTYAENRGRDLDRIFADWQGARLQLEQWLDAFTPRDLNDPQRYPWAQGRALWEFIAENSFEHEREHLPDVRAIYERWQAEGSEAT